MEHIILFVDDEEAILSAIRRMLIHEPYETLFAKSGLEAVELLKKRDVSVIVSDMRMPEMNGVEFLKKALLIRPDAVRIVLSGYADIDTIRELINVGHIWRYISKPWNDDDFKVSLRNALEYYEVRKARQQLTAELQKKNKLLENANTALEEEVRKRTRELEIKARALNMIADMEPAKAIASYILSALGEHREGCRFFLYLPELDIAKDSNDKPLSEEERAVFAKVTETNTSITEGALAAESVAKGNRVFGAIGILFPSSMTSEEGFLAIRGFNAIVAIATAQDLAEKNAPDILNRINAIMGET